MKKIVLGISAVLVLGLFSCEPETISPFNNNGGGYNYPSQAGTMDTDFSNDWDDWTIRVGDTTGWVDTQFSEDWDNWSYSFGGQTGNIRTDFSEDWDDWYMTTSTGNIDISTEFSNDFDRWRVYDPASGRTFVVRTDFSNDWDDWTVYENGSAIISFGTTFSNDFDDWDASGDFSTLNAQQRVAVMFVPIFAGSIYSQGIHE